MTRTGAMAVTTISAFVALALAGIGFWQMSQQREGLAALRAELAATRSDVAGLEEKSSLREGAQQRTEAALASRFAAIEAALKRPTSEVAIVISTGMDDGSGRASDGFNCAATAPFKVVYRVAGTTTASCSIADGLCFRALPRIGAALPIACGGAGP